MCRVMIVDDNPEQVELAKHSLEKQGDEVEGFSDPFLALAAAIDHAPDVILVDYNMPLIEGTRLIKEMKKAGVKSKFILISGFQETSDSLTFRNGKADGYLGKPCLNEELFREVHSVL